MAAGLAQTLDSSFNNFIYILSFYLTLDIFFFSEAILDSPYLILNFCTPQALFPVSKYVYDCVDLFVSFYGVETQEGKHCGYVVSISCPLPDIFWLLS